MDTDEFKRIGADLFGNSWQTRMARHLGVDGSSVRRWVGGAVPVPPAIAAFLRMMGDRQETRGALVFHLQRIGSPSDAILVPDPVVEHMRKKLTFPGVEQLKPMPAVQAYGVEDRVEIRMDDGPSDHLNTEGLSFQITRHPDARHLAGYENEARKTGHDVLSFHHRNHHYSLIVHVDAAGPSISHMISTHSGTLRRISSPAGQPAAVQTSDLTTLPTTGGTGASVDGE
jgi:hypothetical protein